MQPARLSPATGGRSAIRPGGSPKRKPMSSRPPWRGSSWPARSSTTRAGAQRDPERWQRASQLVTHGLLRDAGFTLPPDAEAWDGISVEQAYDRLPEPDPDDGDGDNDAPSGGGADGADSAGTPPSPDSGGDDDSGGSDNGAGDDDPQDGDGQDTGPRRRRMPPSCDPAGTGEVMDAPADSGQGGAEAHPRPRLPPKSRPGTRPCTRRPASPRPRASCPAPSRKRSAARMGAPSTGGRCCAAT